MRGYPNATMRIHVDEKQFFHKELFRYLSQGTKKSTEIDIELVVSEATFQSDPDASKRILRQAHKQGFKSGLDFKGAGFLAIEMLKGSSLNSLILEHSTLSHSISEQEHGGLIQGIKLLCDAIHINLSVNGIKTEADKNRYIKYGVRVLSGSHFSEPQSEQQLETVLGRFKDNKTNLNATTDFAQIVNN